MRESPETAPTHVLRVLENVSDSIRTGQLDLAAALARLPWSENPSCDGLCALVLRISTEHFKHFAPMGRV